MDERKQQKSFFFFLREQAGDGKKSELKATIVFCFFGIQTKKPRKF
jgi:hypothetical protein